MEMKKLKLFDVLKETFTLYSNNINFTIFTFLTSIPMFYFLLYYENFLQKFLLQTSENFQAIEKTSDYWSLPLDIVRNLNKDLFQELIQLDFLYLVPFHLLQLCTILVTVDLASKIYREEKVLTLKDMVHIRIDKERLVGTFIIFLYVVFLSTCTLLGFIWLLINYYTVLRYFSSEYENHYGEYTLEDDVWFPLLIGSSILLSIITYLAWCAIWSLGIVISILEGVNVKALGSAAFLVLRNFQNGVILMLVFSIWELGLILPCLSFGLYKTRLGIYVRIGLFCLGNALKWASFVVYFQDCVRRISGKNVSQEQG